jgi:hypothetical protein
MWWILQPTREKVNRVKTIRFLEGTAGGSTGAPSAPALNASIAASAR